MSGDDIVSRHREGVTVNTQCTPAVKILLAKSQDWHLHVNPRRMGMRRLPNSPVVSCQLPNAPCRVSRVPEKSKKFGLDRSNAGLYNCLLLRHQNVLQLGYIRPSEGI